MCKVFSQPKQRLFYWKCPYCFLVFPDYRRSWASLEMRIRNHLNKAHVSNLTSRQIKLIIDQVFSAYHAVGSFGGGDSYGKG